MSGKVYGPEWKQVRLEVLERDGWRCQIRGPKCTGAATHVDHKIPMSEGGARLDPHNLRASCATCNIKKNRQRQADLASFALRKPGGAGPSRQW